jgi:hypothetical protein
MRCVADPLLAMLVSLLVPVAMLPELCAVPLVPELF